MKTSAQSNAVNTTQRLSLKSSKGHCKNEEPNKLAMKERNGNQQPESSLSKDANECSIGFDDKLCSESMNNDNSSSGFDDETSSDSDNESYIGNHSVSVPFGRRQKTSNSYNRNE